MANQRGETHLPWLFFSSSFLLPPTLLFSSAVEIVGCVSEVECERPHRSSKRGSVTAGRRANDPGTERHVDTRGEARKKETVQVIQEKSGRRPGGQRQGEG